MEENKTLLWAAQSSADCFLQLCPRYFSFPPCSAFYTDCGGDPLRPVLHHKGLSEMKLEGMTPMQSQTTEQVSVQAQEPQWSTVSPVPRRSRRIWLGALAVFLVFAALLIS